MAQTGSYPVSFDVDYPARELHRVTTAFQVGVLRWSLRVVAYAFALTTDRYPPFSLQP